MTATDPTIALALGAGGARGLAHIVVLEALDELGVKPIAIAGSSMGAIVGAAYAAGLSGADLREHALGLLRYRTQVLARLMKARVGRFSDVLRGRGANPVLIDGERFLDLFWPEAVPDRFEQLAIPFFAVATDFHRRCKAEFASGPLGPPVAGSMAIPGLVRPVVVDDRVLVDGGILDPLPYRGLLGKADVVIACDVTGGPAAQRSGIPPPYEAMLGTAQMLQQAITAEMLKSNPPDILVRPAVEHFRALDFFRAKQILHAAEHAKDAIKRGLGNSLERNRADD
jgi:NTE family protein